MPGNGLNILTIKLMPDSPSTDLAKVKEDVAAVVKKIDGGIFHSSKEEPIAFGLKALIIIVAIKESQSPDALETSLGKIEHIQSVEVTDVRRAFG